ncbi:hypothetical protein OROMI_008022 [Orobanche minor]
MQARSYLRTGGHYLISTRPKNNNLTSQIKDPFADCEFLSAGTRIEFKSIGRGHAMVVGGFRMLHKFVSFVELEDPPLYVPLHPYEEHREPEAKYLESDLTPSEQVQKAIKCIDSSESKQENEMSSFRHWTILEYSRAFLSREITPNMVADKFIASEEILR